MSDEFLPPERIGFIGLGNMGAPMASRLVAGGFRVVAADADRATLERFCGFVRCDRASTLTDLGRSCRLVITMLQFRYVRARSISRIKFERSSRPFGLGASSRPSTNRQQGASDSCRSKKSSVRFHFFSSA